MMSGSGRAAAWIVPAVQRSLLFKVLVSVAARVPRKLTCRVTGAGIPWAWSLK